MKSFISSASVITLIAASAVSAGDLVVQGGIFGIAQDSAAIGQQVAVVREGVFRIAKATGFAAASGAPALYDDADSALKAAGSRVLGVYAGASAEGDTEAYVLFGAELGDGQTHVERVFLVPRSEATVKAAIEAPFDGAIEGVAYYTGGKPTSAAGAVTAAVTTGGTTVLNAATVDAEGFANDAKTALTLSATAADLAVDKGDITLLSLVSDNADLVPGQGVTFFVAYRQG